jgi:hypothetical protein
MGQCLMRQGPSPQGGRPEGRLGKCVLETPEYDLDVVEPLHLQEAFRDSADEDPAIVAVA